VKTGEFSQRASGGDRAIRWLKYHTAKTGGILIHSGTDKAYPEVTGYIVPTLSDYGMRDFASELAEWLLTVQRTDGGFLGAGSDRVFLFDTAQALRGLLSLSEASESLYIGAQKAAQHLCKEMISQGAGGFVRQYDNYGEGAIPESIMLYALPPLLTAAKKFGMDDCVTAMGKCIDFYTCNERFLDRRTLLHFLCYEIDAMIDLGRQEKVTCLLKELAEEQKADGSVSAFKGVDWVCVPGLAQLAICWYKAGMNAPADLAMEWLDARQEESGGFLGSIGLGAEYFPRNEISWAVKFYLDAYRLRIKYHFDKNTEKFPAGISSGDGRLLAIAEEIENSTKQTIVEIGCGKGRFVKALREHFPNNDYIGVDISPKMLAHLPDDIGALEGSLENIPLPDDSADIVFSVEAIEHSLNVGEAVAEFSRICKPNGNIVIIDKQESEWGRLACPPWERWPDRDALTALLKRHCASVDSNVIRIDDSAINENLMVKWVGVNGFTVGKHKNMLSAQDAVYRTEYFDELNESLVMKAMAGDCHYFVQMLYDHYLDHQKLWPDEMLENRYGFQLLLELFENGDKNRRIVDVGCGNCELLHALRAIGYEVIGVDVSIVRILNNRNRIRKLFFGFSECLPIDDEDADVVICCECLEHCMDVKASVRELHRVLKPGGTAYIQVPLADKVDCSWHLRLFDLASLRQLVSEHFVIEKIEVIPYLISESPNNIFCVARKSRTGASQ
jgi:malonyl-CoA O-methyltransferase